MANRNTSGLLDSSYNHFCHLFLSGSDHFLFKFCSFKLLDMVLCCCSMYCHSTMQIIGLLSNSYALCVNIFIYELQNNSNFIIVNGFSAKINNSNFLIIFIIPYN